MPNTKDVQEGIPVATAMLVQDIHNQHVESPGAEENCAYDIANEVVRNSEYAAGMEGDEAFVRGRREDRAVRECAASSNTILADLWVRNEERSDLMRQLDQEQQYRNRTPADMYRIILSL
jgi:hypothetical protein